MLLLPSLSRCLRVCHHNDFQARYIETDASNAFCPASQVAANECFSSAARLRSAFDLLDCDVRISAGDFSFAAYNAIGYDIAIFGIEDVTIGVDPIFNTIRSTPHLNWLGTNIKLNVDPEGVTLRKTLDRDGVCFVSALTPLLNELYEYEEFFEIEDPVMAIKTSLAQCRNRQNVVAVTHLGLSADEDLCAKVPELDLVIGGFSMDDLAEDGSYPKRIVRADGSTCFVVTAFAFGRQLGFLDLNFNVGQLSFDGYGVLPLDSRIPLNRDVQRVIDGFSKRLEMEDIGERVARLTAPIPDDCIGRECARGNLVCDALLDASRDADLYIVNSDYSRGSLAAGVVTSGDVLALATFPNNRSLITISGRGILEALENGLSAELDDPIGNGPFPQVAGIVVRFDLTRPVGRRAIRVTIGGHPLDRRERYRVVTSSFLALMNYGYTWDGAKRIEITQEPIRELIASFLRSESPYTPVVEGRLVDVSKRT
ncbi:5'-nucleotidase [Gracilaria domingensis]|nr:5'-nucleotidase [Gracilaria domingensis]